FTSAGMVQFKDVFLGREKRTTLRAASSQRCLRAGGKHNDLENVGYTERHHTFFEMLGNFSFGDYFKRETIHYAWGFITDVLNLPPERLWCTVFEEDDDAAEIWLKDIGVNSERFSRMGAKNNFWAMGDTGPCGPCSEIFYDHGPEIAGGPPGSQDESGDRYVEIWNLVFMQFNRDSSGKLSSLPKPSVDTGMGLERLAAVMQGVRSNYEIDIFKQLIEDVAEVTGTEDLLNRSLRVIADHIRACSFLITDGVLPGNENRSYVLRRIIRRAIRHGYKLGVEEPFFYKLVAPLIVQMGAAYPELIARREDVERVLQQEEQRFTETLRQGMGILEDVIEGLGPDKVISGETVFKLYDTFGFPEDLTADIARERDLTVDQKGFKAAMEAQRKRGRRGSQFMAENPKFPSLKKSTAFTGHEALKSTSHVAALFSDGKSVKLLESGSDGIVVLDATPFYAESGGQVGDTGVLGNPDERFSVTDTQKLGAAHGHIGTVTRGRIAVGDAVTAEVDGGRRAAVMLNHSATHLLHAALRAILGEHVQQKGSLVAPDRTRFDFAHHGPVTPEQLEDIETLVNQHIRHNWGVETRVMHYQDAVDAGALHFFGDTYTEKVRVLKIADFSIELCGGTHVRRTGDIGLFKIVSESGIASGVRRVEGVTGNGALSWVNESEGVLKKVAEVVKGSREDVAEKVYQLSEQKHALERQLQSLKRKLTASRSRDLLEGVEEIGGVRVLAARLDGADAKALRDAADQLRDELVSGVVVLGAVDGDRVLLVAAVTSDLTASLKAGQLIGEVAKCVGGRGGGRADFAQAGGAKPDKLDEALALVAKQVADVVN
ncbi:MAG: alanine--tRNA ligase, partial [Gammaproteobacteria bacterium]